MNIVQILNTKGAAKRIGCSQTWIHKLVAAGKLKAYTYNEDGTLVEHKLEEKRQGQGLYFFISDLDSYQSNAQIRHRRHKNINI